MSTDAPQPVRLRVDPRLLSDALDTLGDVLGVTLDRLAQPVQADAGDDDLQRRLAALSHASGMRTRPVRLSENWHRADRGPLLVFRQQDAQAEPMVVVPARWGGYAVIDPATRTRRRLSRDELSQLAPEAATFYRPLPESVATPAGLLRFGLSAFRGDMLWAAAVAMVAALLGFAPPLVAKVVVDTAIPTADVSLVVQLALLLVAVNLGQIAFEFAEHLGSLRFMTNATAALQAAVWDRLLSLSMPFFRRYNSGDLLNRALLISQTSEVLGASLLRSLLTVLMAAGQLALLFWFSWRLALLVTPLVLLGAVITLVVSRRLRTISQRLEQDRGRLLGFVVQLLSGIAKIRIAGAVERAYDRWQSQYALQIGGAVSVRRWQDLQTLVQTLLPSLATLVVYPWAVHFAMTTSSGVSLGALLGFTTALGAFMAALTSGSRTVSDLAHGLAQQELCAPLLQARPERTAGMADPGVLRGGVTVRDVSFRYAEGRPLVLDGVSIAADPGEFVALVGASGSGKSTLMRLLLGFEPPTTGQMLIDGRDLRGMDPTLVRRQIGSVLQNAKIIGGSIFDNIAAGHLVNIDDAWEAAADAELAEEIRRLPMGMFTILTDGGVGLSGGQKQRLLLARALVMSPKILLLDEATSALDNVLQAAIVRNLSKRQVTRIVVAHRLETIAGADRVYVLEGGRIVQQGSHAELIECDGPLRDMAARQGLIKPRHPA
ncbi:MAG: NHLP bacteriocin export ABC transporter permease/ATPase subunit [Pirellulaceae bacterium]